MEEKKFWRSHNFDLGRSDAGLLKLGFFISQICSINTEAVVRRCSVKMMFLKVLQNSQESTCVGVLFWKNSGLQAN